MQKKPLLVIRNASCCDFFNVLDRPQIPLALQIRYDRPSQQKEKPVKIAFPAALLSTALAFSVHAAPHPSTYNYDPQFHAGKTGSSFNKNEHAGYAKPVNTDPVYEGYSYDSAGLSYQRGDFSGLDVTFSGLQFQVEKRINAQWYVGGSYLSVDSDRADGYPGGLWKIDRTELGLGYIIPVYTDTTVDFYGGLGKWRVDGESIDLMTLAISLRQRHGDVQWRITPAYTDHDDLPGSDIEAMSVTLGIDVMLQKHISVGLNATLSGDYDLFGLGAKYHF